jgi:octaprenyl-diphosphate synthase
MQLEQICLPVKEELEQLDEVMRDRTHSNVSLVTEVAQYIVENGGKRLRPLLCLLSSKLVGYKGNQAIECAAGLEFIHTASLLHDDVIDHAEIRRGRASANAKWGNHISVLVGDFFYCRSSDVFTKTGQLEIVQLITDTITRTTEGEVFETVKSNEIDIREEDYLKIIADKTAVLFAAACEVAGRLAKVSEEFQVALRNYGTHVGMAFQLADDYLDYVSNEDQFGKTRGKDLREGKLTLPLIVALRQASNGETRIIKEALLAERLDEMRFKEVLSILEKFKALEYTRERAFEFSQKAKQDLSIFKASLAKESLLALADYFVYRYQ